MVFGSETRTSREGNGWGARRRDDGTGRCTYDGNHIETAQDKVTGFDTVAIFNAFESGNQPLPVVVRDWRRKRRSRGIPRTSTASPSSEAESGRVKKTDMSP